MKYYKITYSELELYRQNLSFKVDDILNGILESIPYNIKDRIIKLINEDTQNVTLGYVTNLEVENKENYIPLKFEIKLQEYLLERQDAQRFLDQFVLFIFWNN